MRFPSKVRCHDGGSGGSGGLDVDFRLREREGEDDAPVVHGGHRFLGNDSAPGGADEDIRPSESCLDTSLSSLGFVFFESSSWMWFMFGLSGPRIPRLFSTVMFLRQR